ncbi:predicted protein [Histoplasma capsulatum var. duboisii H88]|uniref:Predicted protein n=1 Tax=Ajellomyces capsulatus (strain H88) TaxID=544711 RepID=F0U845_AJEC8|nr:predicted protein [Histoplasma capsulatum var. duboisii H88]
MLEGLDLVIRTLYTTMALVVIGLFCPSGLIENAIVLCRGPPSIYKNYQTGAKRGKKPVFWRKAPALDVMYTASHNLTWPGSRTPAYCYPIVWAQGKINLPEKSVQRTVPLRSSSETRLEDRTLAGSPSLRPACFQKQGVSCEEPE